MGVKSVKDRSNFKDFSLMPLPTIVVPKHHFTPSLSFSKNYTQDRTHDEDTHEHVKEMVNQDIEEIRDLKAQFNEIKRLSNLELK